MGILGKDPNTIINITMAYAIRDDITSRPGYNFSKVRTFDNQSSKNYQHHQYDTVTIHFLQKYMIVMNFLQKI